jgi:hypothetical protein
MSTPTLNPEFLKQEVDVLERLLADKRQQLHAAQSQENGFQWQQYHPRLAVLLDPEQRYGWQSIAYFGFPTKKEAEALAAWLRRHGFGTAYEVRRAERLTSSKWEVKAWDVSRELVERAAAQVAA